MNRIPEKEFSARVPRELKEQFQRLFPYSGAQYWFTNQALVEFNELTEHEDAQREVIDAMLSTRRMRRALNELARLNGHESEDLVEFGAQVPQNEADTFASRFDLHGAVQWFLTNALAAFNEEMSSDTAPRALVGTALRRMLSQEEAA